MKTMVQKSTEVNPTIQVATDIPSNKLEGMIGADAYASFPTSNTTSYETYSKRMSALTSALGNKDEVKG